ncbi:hypothetical protein [Lysinibacillus xylanilyticus]|uniref:YhfM-like domain-containing protein n=1 Tax=Lysinibacillus xylanilyticus TaxID=582475 RepID=A0ABT4EWQ5_9BACI|nr:hypothetical protein [Lysinibacillus xylanilyticus]MCY9550055.1 hypothetical protein [Lysinibacillus xylanilyticus]
MKKLFITFVLLILVGCNGEEKTEVKTFEFAGEIRKINVIGQGTNAGLIRREIENDVKINVIKNAMQNAIILSGPHTDEGPLYELEVIYENGSKDRIDLWYYANAKKGRFYINSMYSLNEETIPVLIELFESYKAVM